MGVCASCAALDMTHPLAQYIKPREWHEKRLLGMGGSDANIVASGREDWIYDLWLLKTKRKEPEDLLNLPVLFGIVTENLNRHWFEHTTGRKVWGYEKEIVHPVHKWLRLSPDGITTASDGRKAYYEAKCVGGWKKVPDLITSYKPQCHHAMDVGGWEVAVLSPFIGNNKQVPTEIEFDPFYWLELFELEKDFWACVTENRELTPDIMRGIR